ncbi:MAG: thiamine diphosphokinase [Butyrivibrio sp.]|nr:thiamine diphosphokinase [Butyrivibrio sp.]
MSRCVIISAGDLPEAEISLHEDDYVIACDAGYAHCRRLGMEPDLIVGDFDSLGDESCVSPVAHEATDGRSPCTTGLLREIAEIEKKTPARVMRLAVRKDETDTFAAARIGLEKGFRSFVLYGAIGGMRLSHTLANLQTLLYLKRNGADAVIESGHIRITVIENETVTFDDPPDADVSLFPAEGAAGGVTLQGMNYNAKDITVSPGNTLAVSNAFIKNRPATVTVGDGTLFVVVERRGMRT